MKAPNKHAVFLKQLLECSSTYCTYRILLALRLQELMSDCSLKSQAMNYLQYIH